MNNEFGDSPCTVALRLIQSCGGDPSFSIPALNSSMRMYTNPVRDGRCTCNTVAFNLLNACAICQGGSSSSFTQWTEACPVVHYGYPEQVATRSINIPEWAFLNVSESDTFDIFVARDTAEGNSYEKRDWAPVQIILPIVVAVVVATVAGVLFYFYRRRLKQRYTMLADSSQMTGYPYSHSHSHQPSYSHHHAQSRSQVSSRKQIHPYPMQPHPPLMHTHTHNYTHTNKPSHQRVISEPTGTQHPSRYNNCSGSSSSLGLDRLFYEPRKAPAWEQAHMTSPRRFGGLLPDRPRVHERTREANWSIDADVDTGALADNAERKSESRSRSGSPVERNKEAKPPSPFALKEARASITSLASKLSRNSGNGNGHARSESQMGLITNSPSPDMESPSRGTSGRGALAGIMNGLNALSHGLGISRRPPPVAVVSSPPRKGFNLDDVDSERSPRCSADSWEGENPFSTVKGKEGLQVQVSLVPDTSGSSSGPSGSGPSWSSSDTGKTNVMLISRSPGQDFNSMISPIESDEFGGFHASTEADYFPAALSDESSLEPGLYRGPPPSRQSGATPPNSISPSRIKIPTSASTNALLVPPAVRAAGGFASSEKLTLGRVPEVTPSSGGVGSAVLPNTRLFTNAKSDGDKEPASALTLATTPTVNSAHPTNSEHSSSFAYTVPNPFVFDERHGGSARAISSLQLMTSGSPPPNSFRSQRNLDLDLAA